MLVAKLVFWASFATVAYCYIGYPMLISFWALARPKKTHTADVRPRVTVVVVAQNEEARIEERVANLLMQDYPATRLDVVVASDGSTDDTVKRARHYAGNRVQVLAFATRRGKAATLNDVVPNARGDIVVFADARQRFAAQAVRQLVAHFADPKVGGVTGALELEDREDSSVGKGVGIYWRYERWLRAAESAVDSTIGATGAIYAIRRSLFVPMPQDTLLDDVLTPLRICNRGYRMIYEENAKAYDKVTLTKGQEFTRKVRTLAGNVQLFAREPWLLNPRDNRLWLQTVSHKALRLVCPAWMAAMFLANSALLFEPLYAVIFGLQVAFYLSALVAARFNRVGMSWRWLQIPHVFCLMNWAVVVGFVRYMRGEQQVVWDRAQVANESNDAAINEKAEGV